MGEEDKIRRGRDNRGGITVGVWAGWPNEKGKIDAEGGFSEYKGPHAFFPVPLMYSNAKCVMLGLHRSLGEASL